MEQVGSAVRSNLAARDAKDVVARVAAASGHGRRTSRSVVGESVVVVAAAAVVVVAVLRTRPFWMDL